MFGSHPGFFPLRYICNAWALARQGPKTAMFGAANAALLWVIGRVLDLDHEFLAVPGNGTATVSKSDGDCGFSALEDRGLPLYG
jgi:hypothetical protein